MTTTMHARRTRIAAVDLFRMRLRHETLLCGLLACGSLASAQAHTDQPAATVDAAPRIDLRTTGRGNWMFSDYRAPAAMPSRSGNSHLVATLVQDGKLRLTLEDAIELAIENNFDIELRRYDLATATTELLRAKGGGQLRGVPTSINELPSGAGGPGEPLLTAVGGYTPVAQLPSSSGDLATITGTQSDLSILSSTPYSTGPGVPGFDPSVTVNVSLSQTIYPQSDAFSTGSNYFSSHSLGGSAIYSQGFSTGTVLTTSFLSNRLNEASTRLNLDPFVTGSLNVTIVQPLLRGFGIHVNRRFISIAKDEDRIEANVFRQQLIATISDVTRLYWDLVSLQQDLHVKQESLKAAERLYQDTKNEVDLGTQAPVDLTSAMAQVASNRQALINAQGLVLQQELLLKEVLTRKGISDSGIASASIDALTPIAPPEADHIAQLSELLDTAMKKRPDLALAEEQEESSRTALRGSRSALLPEFNLIASMQNSGGAGTVSPNLVTTPGTASATPPPNLIGGYGAVLGQVFRRDFPDYIVGAQINIPVRNRIARADAARDDIQYRQSEVRVQQLHSQVRLQVGNAYIAMEQASESYRASVEARRLQEEALDVQQAKFEAGVATAYELLQYQSAVAEARSAEVSALGVYAKAKSALQRATGSTLIDNNIILDPSLTPR